MRFPGIVNNLEHCDEFALLGMMPANFGTHKIQKGIVPHISARSMESSLALIFLCANWAMSGGYQNVYQIK